MSLPIWYDSTETGAPTLNNVAGSLLEVVRACSVNGFNLRSVTSIVVASGVATATAATHGYSASYGKLVRVAGAPVAGLNGDVQPLTVDTNTFTYAAAGVPDGTYTGTITARRAPLDWIEAHTGTNTAIFSRTTPQAFDAHPRIVDTGVSPAAGDQAKVIMVRGATDVDTYTAQAPTNAQVSNGMTANKGANNTTAKRWLLVGTDRDLFLFVQAQSAVQYVPSIMFGDGLPYRAGDVNFSFLACTSGSSASSVSNSMLIPQAFTSAPGVPASGCVFSSESGIGGPEAFYTGSPFKGGGGWGDTQTSNPTTITDFVIAFDPFVRTTTPGVRGVFPGIGEGYINNTSFPWSDFSVLTMDNGDRVLGVRCIYSSSFNTGVCFFKLSSGWRG